MESVFTVSPGTVAYVTMEVIRDSNQAMLLAAATQKQCKVLDLGIAKDNEEDLEKILDDAFASGMIFF
ncbi:Molybdopterin biosynthesis protein CNX1 [Quillaja saponaria]|uniref:Molybdopterin biosynthesis protein CNX1 n=1 Tax=Quillaja saponaria TaxID=32244 RepID=A0AAD7PMR4_QUISA|nr:Molybdopterin biosynthesis protein CNX1 [Quillaja saponaria]